LTLNLFMPAPFRPRLVYLFIFLACVGLMAFGLYLQHVEHLEPCPLCIFQRYAFLATGAIALIAAIHNPGRVGQWLYGALLIIFAGIGALIAGRQTWLQHNPPLSQDCGPDLSYMLNSFPLGQVLPKVFQGEGDCAKVVWEFLGLSIPEWALIWFGLFLLAVLLALVIGSRRRRSL
jgi:protein dithiol:quinone oxidoreductase